MPNPNIRPLSRPKHIRMAVVAKSGFGKTVFAGTAPNALFITTDPEGTASAAAFGSTAQEWAVSDQAGLQAAFRYLEQGGIDELGLEWVIVDNLTECQAIFMQHAIDAGVRRKPDRNQFVPELQDYLVAQNATIDLVKKFSTLPVNLIFTMHTKGREDPDGNDYFSAAIQGKDGEVAEQILGYMNVIGMGAVLTLGDPPKRVRRIYFDFVREYRGKDRFNVLGAYQDDLSVPDMIEQIFGEEDPAPTVTTTETKTVNRPRPKPRRG